MHRGRADHHEIQHDQRTLTLLPVLQVMQEDQTVKEQISEPKARRPV